MKPIYLHEFTLIPWNRKRIGIQQITITVVTEDREPDSFMAQTLTDEVLEADCNVVHRLIIEGYLDE